MLVLTRRVQETIHIGPNVIVQLNVIRIGRVRISIRAPRHLRIDRPEVRTARQERPAIEDNREDQTGMGTLTLSRHPGESILIGEDIEVAILALRGNAVVLGVTAPPNVSPSIVGPVAPFTRFGPPRPMNDVPFTIRITSESAGR